MPPKRLSPLEFFKRLYDNHPDESLKIKTKPPLMAVGGRKIYFIRFSHGLIITLFAGFLTFTFPVRSAKAAGRNIIWPDTGLIVMNGCDRRGGAGLKSSVVIRAAIVQFFREARFVI